MPLLKKWRKGWKFLGGKLKKGLKMKNQIKVTIEKIDSCIDTLSNKIANDEIPYINILMADGSLRILQESSCFLRDVNVAKRRKLKFVSHIKLDEYLSIISRY